MSYEPTLARLMHEAARRFAARCCLVDGDRRYSFAQFDALCDALATALASRLEPGSRIALFMRNRAEYLLLHCAIERTEFVRVPVNARSTAADVAAQLADCGAAAVFFDGTTADQLGNIADATWAISVDGPAWADLLTTEPRPELLFLADPRAACSLNYTSGSSGVPKGAILTHGNWLAVVRNMLVDRDIRGDDRLAHVGPLSHASGSYFAPWFLRGGCSYIVPGGQAEALLDLIEREAITVFTCVPTFLTRLLAQPCIAARSLGSLRTIGYGAEAIPRNTLDAALARFGPILAQNYGQTEAYMTITTLAAEDHFFGDSGSSDVRVGCIGKPYTFVEVVLRAPDGAPVPTGEAGEITVRADHVMQGYWNKPEESAAVLRDGWLWTGDLARADAGGFLYMVGRSREMLISGGFNIYPGELEALLTSHPAVNEAAVIGVPDDRWGEIAVAIVSAAADRRLNRDELDRFCKQRIGIRAPKRFVVVDHLPKSPTGKVDKKALRAGIAGEGLQ